MTNKLNLPENDTKENWIRAHVFFFGRPPPEQYPSGKKYAKSNIAARRWFYRGNVTRESPNILDKAYGGLKVEQISEMLLELKAYSKEVTSQKLAVVPRGSNAGNTPWWQRQLKEEGGDWFAFFKAIEIIKQNSRNGASEVARATLEHLEDLGLVTNNQAHYAEHAEATKGPNNSAVNCYTQIFSEMAGLDIPTENQAYSNPFTFVEKINAEFESGELALVRMANVAFAQLQAEVVKEAMKNENISIAEEYFKENHGNSDYLEKGKGCSCNECRELPEGHPYRSTLFTGINHVGEMGRDVPTHCKHRELNICSCHRRQTDSSSVALIAAGIAPNNGQYKIRKIIQHNLATMGVMNSNGRKCAFTGKEITRDNYPTIDNHHPTEQLKLKVIFPDRDEIILDTAKFDSIGNLVLKCKSHEEFEEMLIREIAVTVPVDVRAHQYFHYLLDNPELLERMGIEPRFKRTKDFWEVHAEDIPASKDSVEEKHDHN